MPGRRRRSRRTSRASRRVEPRPIAGPDAFRDLREPDHVRSQAATLLLIGTHLRGDAPAAAARAAAAGGRTRAGAPDPLPAADVRALGFPRMRAGAARVRPVELLQALGVRVGPARGVAPAPRDARALSAPLLRAARAFYRDANPVTAAALLEISLRHPRELVRVSAAASYFEVAIDPAPAIRVLERGLESRDLLAREVAAHALAHVDPQNPALRGLLAARRSRSARRPSHTSLLVHGTWARASSWWQPPAGDFWRYVHDEVDASLYGASDRFDWSGGYSDAARALGGSDLHSWVQGHSLAGLDLFAHSHGGSVAMLTSQAGTAVGRMVLLSCPVHWPKYMPAFSAVGKVVSVRVRLDLVILADRGGQRFTDSRIEEHVLPIWFDHFATHDPATWRTYDVPSML